MSYSPSHPKYGPLPPWRISAERFNELLNVLPPGRHQCGVNVESFFLIERLSGDIVMWAVRVGSPHECTPLYFCFNAEARLSSYALEKMVWLAVEQDKAGKLPASEDEVLAGLS